MRDTGCSAKLLEHALELVHHLSEALSGLVGASAAISLRRGGGAAAAVVHFAKEAKVFDLLADLALLAGGRVDDRSPIGLLAGFAEPSGGVVGSGAAWPTTGE